MPLTADQLLAAASDAQRGISRRDEAKEFLAEFLNDGPKDSTDVIATGTMKQWGLKERTIRRASMEMKIVKKKNEFDGGWTWELPAEK